MKLSTLLVRTSSSLPRLTLALPLVLAACHASVVVTAPVEPPPPPAPLVYWESEPNDEAWLAAWFGSMYPGESIWVHGSVTDDGSDPQDGLEFTAYGPCRIDFTLFVDDPWADLDVWLYDPWTGEFVAAFTLPYGDEKGTFWVDATTEFQLVVVPAYGASTWTLAVEAWGNSYALGTAEGASENTPIVFPTHERGLDSVRSESAGEARTRNETR